MNLICLDVVGVFFLVCICSLFFLFSNILLRAFWASWSGVWCWTLIWQDILSPIPSNISSLFPSLFLTLLLFLFYIIFTCCSCHTIIGYYVLMFFPIFFLFVFQLWKFLLSISSSSEILFLSYVHSINESIKGIFLFCYSVFFFLFLALLFSFFLEFPSFCLYYPSIFACCLLFTRALIILIIVA